MLPSNNIVFRAWYTWKGKA